MERLIHVDWNASDFGPTHHENCIFLEQPCGDHLTLPEVTDHILGVIAHDPLDCRVYLYIF